MNPQLFPDLFPGPPGRPQLVPGSDRTVRSVPSCHWQCSSALARPGGARLLVAPVDDDGTCQTQVGIRVDPAPLHLESPPAPSWTVKGFGHFKLRLVGHCRGATGIGVSLAPEPEQPALPDRAFHWHHGSSLTTYIVAGQVGPPAGSLSLLLG